MIVRDDSERGIPPLVAHQPPTTLADAPVVRGRMVQIPGWIIPLYAGLFIALGWFGGEQWRGNPPEKPARPPRRWWTAIRCRLCATAPMSTPR